MSVLTPKFIKVTKVDNNGESAWEIGGSRWHIRVGIEGLKDLYEKLRDALEDEGKINF